MTSPLEIRNQIHLENEADFIDFCETHPVPKQIDLKSRELKNEYIDLILQELKLVKPLIKKQTSIIEKTNRPHYQRLEFEKSLVHQLMGLDDWFEKVTRKKNQNLIFLIDNSNSISFFRKLDIAKSLGLILKSYEHKPKIKILLFSERVKEFELKDSNLESILKDYLAVKSAGFTDFSGALMKLEDLLRNYKNSHGIIISDGISSVGKKMPSLNFKNGKVHYMKLGNKKSPVDEALASEVHHKKGQLIEINSNTSLFKPIYQIIKRL